MDLINGVSEKNLKMESERIVNDKGEPIGLVEQIRIEQEKAKLAEPIPYKPPKYERGITILTSYEGAMLLRKALGHDRD